MFNKIKKKPQQWKFNNTKVKTTTINAQQYKSKTKKPQFY